MFDPAAIVLRQPQPDKPESPGGARSRMNVSPLDLDSSDSGPPFAASTRSRSPRSSTAVADDYEQALRETDRLRQDVARMEAALNEHREHEKNLKATLLTAQKLADDIKAQAEEEAKRIVREAQGRSDLLLEKTQARLEDIQREYRRPEAQAPGRRDLDRGDDPDAAQHARVRPRTGSARARRASSAPPPAATADSSRTKPPAARSPQACQGCVP